MRIGNDWLAGAWVLLFCCGGFGFVSLAPAEILAAEVEAVVEAETMAKTKDVDRRPLNVQIVPAFPNLEWSDELTGAETGKAKMIRPLIITDAGDQSNRMFVATQFGQIFTFENDAAATELTEFLDFRDRVEYKDNMNEEGFLGLAFHPHFAVNGEFFVYYTAAYSRDGGKRRSVISRFRVSKDDPSRADPASEEILLTIPQPYWNHNGGTLAFGPDGYLYIAVGDGGDGNDPHGNGQNLKTLLATMLRIDVDKRSKDLPYAIPEDNPFADRGDEARGEIWAYGLRNVWRFSFDRETGLCWAADVGQNAWEEIDIVRKGGNYGWNLREGKHPLAKQNGQGPREDLIEPIWEYEHEIGKSITGGSVYRGSKVPELYGAYLYTDYVSGYFWALWYDSKTGQVTANRPIRTKGAPIVTFGEDAQGEIYFTEIQGGIFKFASPKAK